MFISFVAVVSPPVGAAAAELADGGDSGIELSVPWPAGVPSGAEPAGQLRRTHSHVAARRGGHRAGRQVRECR